MENVDENKTQSDLARAADVEKQSTVQDDHPGRGQWLRAAVLGSNDGLLSTASLMMGIGAVRADVKIMVLTGIAGTIAGALSMALGEFVSVYTQYDTELAQIERDRKNRLPEDGGDEAEWVEKKKALPSPTKAAVTSAVSFTVGAAVPLLAAAFIRKYVVRLVAVAVASGLALVAFGVLSARLGKVPVLKSTLRVFIGGLIAMGITFGLSKLVGSTGL